MSFWNHDFQAGVLTTETKSCIFFCSVEFFIAALRPSVLSPSFSDLLPPRLNNLLHPTFAQVGAPYVHIKIAQRGKGKTNKNRQHGFRRWRTFYKGKKIRCIYQDEPHAMSFRSFLFFFSSCTANIWSDLIVLSFSSFDSNWPPSSAPMRRLLPTRCNFNAAKCDIVRLRAQAQPRSPRIRHCQNDLQPLPPRQAHWLLPFH